MITKEDYTVYAAECYSGIRAPVSSHGSEQMIETCESKNEEQKGT
jgi:hypothetical protein